MAKISVWGLIPISTYTTVGINIILYICKQKNYTKHLSQLDQNKFVLNNCKNNLFHFTTIEIGYCLQIKDKIDLTLNNVNRHDT